MWVRHAEVRRLLAQIRDLKGQIVALSDDLRDERERSRRREDELLDRVLLASGRHSLTPDPKQKTQSVEPSMSQPLNALEEARLVALREAAIAAGRPAHEADRFLEAERAGKPIFFGLPDEPYVVPT